MIRQPSGTRDNTRRVTRTLNDITLPMYFETAHVIPYLTKNTTVQCPNCLRQAWTSLDDSAFIRLKNHHARKLESPRDGAR